MKTIRAVPTADLPESYVPPVDEAVSDPLRALRAARARQRLMDAKVDELVRLAVETGYSYVTIGEALGVTRQAARTRFLRMDASVDKP